MDIDVAQHIGAVTRTVKDAERDGRPVRLVSAARTFDTEVEDVWDAITNAERIPRWFLPVTGDLRLGGRYQLEGNASGEITACEPPCHLALTWEFSGAVSWVEVELAADASGRTRLELVHVVPADDHWEQFGPGATGVGWELGLMGLTRHLETGAAADPTAAMAWLGSEQGKDFMRRSSDRWREVSIASGADETWSREAAERTTAAYTGG